MSTFDIRFETEDLSDEDLTLVCNAVLKRISIGKLRVRTGEGLKDIGFETDIARWNGDPV